MSEYPRPGFEEIRAELRGRLDALPPLEATPGWKELRPEEQQEKLNERELAHKRLLRDAEAQASRLSHRRQPLTPLDLISYVFDGAAALPGATVRVAETAVRRAAGAAWEVLPDPRLLRTKLLGTFKPNGTSNNGNGSALKKPIT